MLPELIALSRDLGEGVTGVVLADASIESVTIMRRPDEDRDERDANIIGPHGARGVEDQCTTCIYHPGNRMGLAPGRLKQLTNDTLRDGTWIVCHDTVPPYPHDVASAAMCRGFLDLFGERSEGVRFLREVFGFDEVARPEDRSSTSGQHLHRDRPPR